MKVFLQLLVLLVSLSLLSACSTLDRSRKDATDPIPGGTTSYDSGTATGLDGRAGLYADPLNDPNSPLANRVIYFDFDRSEVRSEFVNTIAAHGRFLAENPQIRVRAEGHTDERGTREYNLGLGERRAQSVRRMLMTQGAREQQIEVISYGEEAPAAFGSHEGAWRLNRRVELVYPGTAR